MRPANVTGLTDVTGLPTPVTSMQQTYVASCANDRSVMYAVANGAPDNHILALLRSKDGGQNWEEVDTTVVNNTGTTNLSSAASHQGGYVGCIDVSPVNSSVVVLGWSEGPFISGDSGKTWRQYGGVDQSTIGSAAVPALHADLHVVYFNPTGKRLYVGSDGGVVAADVQITSSGAPLLSNFASIYNKNLANLQFYGSLSRSGPNGALSVNDQLAAGGLQDNGDVYCQWGVPSPWQQVAESDGGVTMLAPGGDLFFNNTNPPDAAYGKRGRWNGRSMSDLGVVPVLLADGTVDPAIVLLYGNDSNGRPNDPSGGLSGRPGGRSLVVDAVQAGGLASTLTGNQQNRVLAVGGVANQVYGLFPDNHGSPFWHWELLATLQLVQNDYITAVGSSNGLTILVGTNSGHIYSVTPGGGAPIDMATPSTGRVSQFILGTSLPGDGYALTDSGGKFLQLIHGNPANWRAISLIGTGVRGTIFSIAVDWNRSPGTLYIAKENRVYITLDQGSNWGDFSAGLPRDVHCADLRISSGRLFLSTWGRSLWSAGLWQGSPNPPPRPRPPVPGQHPPQPPRPRPM